MPTYEYHCPRCGCRVEFLRPVEKRNDMVYCQSCGSDGGNFGMERSPSAPNFVVVGGTPTFHK